MFRIVEDPQPPIPEGCSELLRDFLVRCFHRDPQKRPDAKALFGHPWLTKYNGVDKVPTLHLSFVTSSYFHSSSGQKTFSLEG
jgi:serine/threonine protein kinase